MSKWHETLTDEQKMVLSCNGSLPLPIWPSYSCVREIQSGVYFGEIGYGNGTAHKVMIIPVSTNDFEAVYIKVFNRNCHGEWFDLNAAKSGIEWIEFVRELKLYASDAHHLSLNVQRILNALDNDEPVISWGRGDHVD